MLFDAEPRVARRRRLIRRMRPFAGMQGVAALVIGAPPAATAGELYRQGMRGMGGMGANILQEITGGATDKIQAQLAKVELALKISTAAAVASALVSLLVAARRR